MIKKVYLKPETELSEGDLDQQILAGSVTSLTTSGLDDDLILPDDEETKSGSVWEEAW